MLEHEDTRKKLERYFIGFFIVIALVYGGYQARPLLFGPTITI